MHWDASGILLSIQPYGETAAIAQFMTEFHGRHAGIIYGASSRKLAPVLQPGNQFKVTWNSKLSENLGWFKVELEYSRSVAAWSDNLTLQGLVSVCSLLEILLPEREPYSKIYRSTVKLFDDMLNKSEWLLGYLLWELQLVTDTGFGLELDRCAVTNSSNDLKYISPRTGRAISTKGAGEWINQLLPLPECFLTGILKDHNDVLDGLVTTGYFLDKGLKSMSSKTHLPAARERFLITLKQMEV